MHKKPTDIGFILAREQTIGELAIISQLLNFVPNCLSDIEDLLKIKQQNEQ